MSEEQSQKEEKLPVANCPRPAMPFGRELPDGEPETSNLDPNDEVGRREQETESLNLQPETETMEVHHHPQLNHQPKPWKEYLLEGLMIFIAVTMGFFAEGIRENMTDHSKEHEYILSMIEDAKTDTMNFRIAIELNRVKVRYMDSLASYCFYYDGTTNSDSALYRLCRRTFSHPDFANPTERTLVQLKNAGGMRLLRKKVAVDSILFYDAYGRKLVAQQSNCDLFQSAIADLSIHLFNFKYYGSPDLRSHSKNLPVVSSSEKLLSVDTVKLIEFGNRVSMYRGIVFFYTVRLQEMHDHAVNLIRTLQKEYHLENE